VAKPVVYSHFANRHQVAIALLDEHFEAMHAFSREKISTAKTLDEYLSQLVDSGFDFESASGTPVRKITNGFSAGDEVNQAFDRHEEEIRRRWRKLLELLNVPKDVAEIAAHALMGIMNNVVFNGQALPNRKRARDTVKKLILSAIHALLPSSEGGQPLDAIRSFDFIYNVEPANTDKKQKAPRKARGPGPKSRKTA
jgi:AcrR family transcriptional regulator